MDERRHSRQARPGDERDAGVSAHADGDGRALSSQEAPRLDRGASECGRHQRSTWTRERHHVDEVQRVTGIGDDPILEAAAGSHERNACRRVEPPEGRSECQAREDVPSGAAGGDEDRRPDGIVGMGHWTVKVSCPVVSLAASRSQKT